MVLKIKLSLFFKTNTPKQIVYGRRKKLNKIGSPFLVKKKKKKSKTVIRDIRTLFEQEEDYKPKRVSNFWNNNYIEYESNGDETRNLSLDYCLNKIEPYLRNIIIDLQNPDIWKIQLTIAINFISSKYIEEECVMHSRSNNIKFTSYNDVNETVDELFESLC